MRTRPRLAALSLCLFGLSACAALSPGGILAAARLDPLNTPPGDIAIAVIAPDAIQLRDGDAEFRIALHEGGATLVDATVPLLIRRGGAGAPAAGRSGEQVFVAQMDAEGAEAVAAAQSEIRRLRGSGVEGRGAMSVTIVGGCRTGAALTALPISTWMRTDLEDGFTRLTGRVDVLDQLEAAGFTPPPCSNAT